MSQDINVLLIKKAIEMKNQVVLIPRRSHTVKGIPINFEEDILRVWINTGKNIESILFSEIGHFSFSVELWNMIEHNGFEKVQTVNKQIKKGRIDKNTVENKESATDYMIRKQKENIEKVKDGSIN